MSKFFKHKIMPFAMALLALSCAQAADGLDTDGRGQGCSLSLSREAFVKSFIDGNSVSWSKGDEVAVFGGEGTAPKKFTAREDGMNARFDLQKGETVPDVSGGGNYYLVYPYSSVGSTEVSSNTISLNIPARQTAVPGSFDPSAAVSVAAGSDWNADFLFRNAHALFKITVPENFGADIVQIRLSANGEGEGIAGDFVVTFDPKSPAVTAVDGSVPGVVLAAGDGSVLAPGDYYIVTAPVTVSSGICAEYIGADGRVYFRYSTKGMTFRRNTIYDLGAPVEKAGTSVVLEPKYYTEGVSYVYGGRENIFPAVVSDVTDASFTSLPDGWRARLEKDRLVVIPDTESERGNYEIQLFAYAEGAKADIYTFRFKYDPALILYDGFDGSDIDDRYWRRFNDHHGTLWSWFQTGDEAQSPVADGKLQLKAVYENGTYKTGAVTGQNLFDYEPPFRIDCRAAMSRRETGFWCAVWTVPTTGYQNGEIDIMEAGNHYTSSDFTSKIHCTCHNPYTLNTPSKKYEGFRPGQDQPQSGSAVLDNPNDYHIYSVEVTDEAVTWYADGVQIHQYKNIRHTTDDNGYKYAAESTTSSAGETIYPKANYLKNYPFMENRYFAIFDIAVGSSFVGGTNKKDEVPATECFNAQFDIDWIKISKIK